MIILMCTLIFGMCVAQCSLTNLLYEGRIIAQVLALFSTDRNLTQEASQEENGFGCSFLQEIQV